jgi:predicted transcriptional regulator
MPSPPKSKYLGVKLPADLKKRIDRAARRQDRSLSSFVRHTLRKRLDAEDRLREDAAPASQ